MCLVSPLFDFDGCIIQDYNQLSLQLRLEEKLKLHQLNVYSDQLFSDWIRKVIKRSIIKQVWLSGSKLSLARTKVELLNWIRLVLSQFLGNVPSLKKYTHVYPSFYAKNLHLEKSIQLFLALSVNSLLKLYQIAKLSPSPNSNFSWGLN